MTIAIVSIVLVALLFQIAALRRMGERRPIGDEVSYLARGAASDPLAPRLFLRTPVLPLLAKLCYRLENRKHSDDRSLPRENGRYLRRIMATVSVLTIVLTAFAGWRLGGEGIAFLGALVLTVQPERVIYGCHIWPDPLLAFSLTALIAISQFPPDPWLAFLAGWICCFGVLSRIDFLAVIPLFFLAWTRTYGDISVVSSLALFGPPFLGITTLTLHNGRRYGVLLPDTTWAFNFSVAASEASRNRPPSLGIDGLVDQALIRWNQADARTLGKRCVFDLLSLLRRPSRLWEGIWRRFLTVLGPDTFVRHKLLPKGAAYPDLGVRSRKAWIAVLTVSFPLLIVLVVVASVSSDSMFPGYTWPSIGLLAVSVSFHTRTRYRLVAMPALSLLAAEGLVVVTRSFTSQPLFFTLVTAGCVLLFLVLLRVRAGNETTTASLE